MKLKQFRWLIGMIEAYEVVGGKGITFDLYSLGYISCPNQGWTSVMYKPSGRIGDLVLDRDVEAWRLADLEKNELSKIDGGFAGKTKGASL